MDVLAKITGIKYSPFLCRNLSIYPIERLGEALSKTFILGTDKTRQIALSRWVSPKRTRSYPYARVYDSLSFQGKKATIIPIIKDEGKEGDRDFLQWDTISLMSLLNIYTIISYYVTAEKSLRYKDKITDQRFDITHLMEEISNLLSYQSDALHWNLAQTEKAGEICQKALDSYERISKILNVEMHSKESARKRSAELLKGKENFMTLSRGLAKKAQNRKAITIQPKERLSGNKATLTIINNHGGYYFFTCDEVKIKNRTIYLIEGKHSKQSCIPSMDDIKDGLLKMILFTNLKEVKIDNTEYIPVPILKLTGNIPFSIASLRKSQIENLRLLKKEAEKNSFHVQISGVNLQEIEL